MSDLKDTVLGAARADGIPQGESGPWSIRKFVTVATTVVPKTAEHDGYNLPPGLYTNLHRRTEKNPSPGELVMHDAPHELHTHLEFMLKAHGNVLITGLGLGCVTRGCLANPAVKSVTVIERDPHVLMLVAKHMPQGERLTIVKADAVDWCERTEEKFDVAWHDLWSDPELDEPHLQVTHMHLICAMHGRVKFQGAWQFPREYRRLMAPQNVI